MQSKSLLSLKASFVFEQANSVDSLILLQRVHLYLLHEDTDPVKDLLKFSFEWVKMSARCCGLLNANTGSCCKTNFTLDF